MPLSSRYWALAVLATAFAAALSAGCSLAIPGAERPQWSLTDPQPSAAPVPATADTARQSL